MKALIIVLLLGARAFHAYSQGIIYHFTISDEGYSGRVKRVTTYSRQVPNVDSIKLDSSLAKRPGVIRSVKIFNEKGLLERLETYNEEGNLSVRTYAYNSIGNLILISKQPSDSRLPKKDTFEYDHERLRVIQTMSYPENIQTTDKKVEKIYSKELIFDDKSRNTRINYRDSAKAIVLSTRFYYDDNSNLILCETFTETEIKNKYIQSWDAEGRKKIIQSIDGGGNFTLKRVYTWIGDDAVTLEIFDANGKTESKTRETFIRDNHGNIVKKYYYDLIDRSAVIYEYIFDYY